MFFRTKKKSPNKIFTKNKKMCFEEQRLSEKKSSNKILLKN
jgi:hypothetical protein